MLELFPEAPPCEEADKCCVNQSVEETNLVPLENSRRGTTVCISAVINQSSSSSSSKCHPVLSMPSLKQPFSSSQTLPPVLTVMPHCEANYTKLGKVQVLGSINSRNGMSCFCDCILINGSASVLFSSP